MFVVFLRFNTDPSQAVRHMDGHKAWLQQGFDDGVFLLSGSLAARAGGMLLAHYTTHEALQARLALDPFVAEGVVQAEIVPVTPARADARLQFLMEAR